MATIKTNFFGGIRRIVTKITNGVRRASCSCCGGVGCCMYPARAFFDGLYAEEDLPDELTINPYDLNSGPEAISVNVQRNGLEYSHDFGGGYIQTITIRENVFGSPQWVFLLGDSTSGTILDASDCLFARPLNQIEGIGVGGITDLFEDYYDVEWSGGTTGNLGRFSLCLWQGFGLGNVIYFDENTDPFYRLFYNGPLHRWIYFEDNLSAVESGGTFEKDGEQDGPEGTYSPSTNVPPSFFAGQGTITVSKQISSP